MVQKSLYDQIQELGINGYKDSLEMAMESQYQKGMAQKESGDYDGATATMNAISGYNDAASQAYESQYQKANALNAEGDYDAAYQRYASITGYKDVDDIIENDDNIAAAAAAWRSQFKVGNTVVYGRYEQDNDAANGKEAIEWIVLNNDRENYTIVSKYALVAHIRSSASMLSAS